MNKIILKGYYRTTRLLGSYYYIIESNNKVYFKYCLLERSIIIDENYDNFKSIIRSKKELDKFINEFNQHISMWDNDYIDNNILDGKEWLFNINNNEFKGYNKYPNNFKEFILFMDNWFK